MPFYVANLKEKMQKRWRKKRVSLFIEKMKPDSNTRIIDLGGTPFFWDLADTGLDIVLFNTSEEIKQWSPESIIKYSVIAGDTLHYPFKAMEYDIVFCNSVIEHIPPNAVKEFAQIIKNIAPHYWVQTPSKYFPIEAHCNLLFWWFYPNKVKAWWVKKWNKNGAFFLADQMQTTNVFCRKQILDLFPQSFAVNERVFGVIKSYSVWR